jgi:YD repeat-containing protein
MKTILLMTASLVLTSGAASAQSATVYGPDGRVQSRTLTDSRGNTTTYDASGSVAGRTTTSGSTATIYDGAGRKVGTVQWTGPKR